MQSERGDTYGVVCAAVLVLLALVAVVAFRLLSAKPSQQKPIAQQPTAVPTGYPLEKSAASPAATPDAKAAAILANGVTHSQSLAKRRISEKGTISPRAGGYSETFEYERMDDLERLQLAAGNFVHKIGNGWVRANGWSLQGPAVSPAEASLLHDLIGMTTAPWSASSSLSAATVVDSKQPGTTVLHTRHSDQRERLFVFRNAGADLELNHFSGPVGNGRDEVQVTLDLTYPTPSPPKAVAVTSPVPEKARRQASASRKRARP